MPVRPRLVARGRARDAVDRLDERGRRHVDDVLAAGLGQRRKVLGAQRPDVERRRAGDDLDVLLGRPQLEARVGARQRARDFEHEAGRQDDRALALDGGLQRDAQADLHVGGAQFGAATGSAELDAGERLHGAARRGDAGHDAKLSKQVRARGRELHDEDRLKEMEVIERVEMCRT
jgi:hypothetical protein